MDVPIGADREVIGRAVEINGHGCAIIGVMPRDFNFPMRLATTVRTPSPRMDFGAPLGVDPVKADRSAVGYAAIARLRPGISIGEADQDLDSISRGLQREYPRRIAAASCAVGSRRTETLAIVTVCCCC